MELVTGHNTINMVLYMLDFKFDFTCLNFDLEFIPQRFEILRWINLICHAFVCLFFILCFTKLSTCWFLMGVSSLAFCACFAHVSDHWSGLILHIFPLVFVLLISASFSVCIVHLNFQGSVTSLV